MSIRLEVTTREVYGVAKIYPANEAARVIAEIAGTKTITPQMLELCKKLDAEIVDVTPSRVPQ